MPQGPAQAPSLPVTCQSFPHSCQGHAVGEAGQELW